MLRRLWTLIFKELQATLRDPGSRRVLIMPVLIQIFILPFAATLEVKNTHLGIYIQDAGARSVELTQRIAKSTAFPHVKIYYGIQQVRQAIDTEEVLGVVTFPADFSRDIDSGKTASMQALMDGRHSNSAQIAVSYLQDIIEQYNKEITPQRKKFPSTVIVRNWFNPNLDYYWFILPALIALITTLGCMIVTAMSVAREREQGTFDQLLVSPLTPGLIMIGKAIPAIIVATIQATIILLVSIFFYRVPFQGSFVLLYICILCYGFSLAGVGLLISSVCSTQQQAFLGVFGFVVPALLLSGFISPIENIVQPLQAVTWFNPLRHFITISKGIYLKNFDFALVWPDLWPLLVIGLMTLLLAYAKFIRYSR